MKVSFWQMLKWTVVVWVFCNILWVEIAWIIIQDSLLQLEHLLRLMLLASLFPGKAVGMLFLPQKSTTLSYSLGPKPSLDLFSLKTFNEVVKSFRQFLTVLEAAKWINLYFRKKFPLATPLMVSFFFLRKKTICFISLDKASAKSNDCWNSFDALLGLTPLRFNKLCTVFRFDVLRVTFSCFLSTAFFFYFLCCSRILNFVCVFFSNHSFFRLALLFFL